MRQLELGLQRLSIHLWCVARSSRSLEVDNRLSAFPFLTPERDTMKLRERLLVLALLALFGGQIVSAVTAAPNPGGPFNPADATHRNRRVNYALYLVLTSAQYQVQR
jgi:hypothetical protein